MHYLLDTNIVINVLKQPAGSLAARLSRVLSGDAVVCSVVEAELYHGAMKYGLPARRRAALAAFLEPFHSVPFDSSCVPQYAMICDKLERKGQIIGGNDLMIAAIAKTHDLTLVTNNTAEFGRVEGLRVEDWVS